MEWEKFLKHPKVIAAAKNYLSQPVGRYLYKKLLHDMLECLNGYKGFLAIASSMQNISDDISYWFFKWNPPIETWILELTNLSEQHYQLKTLPDDTAWPSLIAELAYIPNEISLLYAEAQMLTLPTEEPLRDLIKRAIDNIARLNFICRNIENQEYLHLWTIGDNDITDV